MNKGKQSLMICSFDKVKTRALLQNVRFQEHSENKALVLLFANYQTKESTVLWGPSGSVISYRKSFFFTLLVTSTELTMTF